MRTWRWADADTVRNRIASACARDERDDMRLGEITLRDHQREAAGRLREAIQRFGGALLADEVGLGKTYTALAAARDATSLLVVAPAAIADMWRGALERTRLQATVVSVETLSRRDPAIASPALVIVDEAHHLRNPRTRRYARLAEITRSSAVLLLSATPVHNATADLHSLLALFLGSRAGRMTAGQLAACIVRRTRDDVRDVTLPHRAPPVWLDVHGSADVLEALAEIPPPCPPRDGTDGGALITLSLVRAWASTEAALRAALLRRVARASALADALATGRHPTRAELLAWVVGEDATQLAFPELMVATLTGEWSTLSESVERHVAGVRRALAVLSDRGGAADDGRCVLVRDIRARHTNERVVVFSQFADSVRAMFARLRADGRVAAVTASGADVAGGPLTRADVIGRFAPRSVNAVPPARQKSAEQIDLLITTDLLSEGLNLQDASVVVHLDLPWTAARLTQRLGRVWRMGSPHARVHEYAIAPPAPADQLLRLTEILMAKAGAASRAVGDAMAPLLAQRASVKPATDEGAADPTTAREALLCLFRQWASRAGETAHRLSQQSCGGQRQADVPIVASVRAQFSGWIAAVYDGRAAQLFAARGDGAASTDPTIVLDVAQAAGGRGCVAAPSRVARAMCEIEAFMTAQRAARDAGVPGMGSRAHALASGRIATVAAAAPAHRRGVVSRLAARARRAVAASRTAGAERLLSALLADPSPPPGADDVAEAWLSRVIEIGGTPEPNAVAGPSGRESATVLAVLLLVQ